MTTVCVVPAFFRRCDNFELSVYFLDIAKKEVKNILFHDQGAILNRSFSLNNCSAVVSTPTSQQHSKNNELYLRCVYLSRYVSFTSLLMASQTLDPIIGLFVIFNCSIPRMQHIFVRTLFNISLCKKEVCIKWTRQTIETTKNSSKTLSTFLHELKTAKTYVLIVSLNFIIAVYHIRCFSTISSYYWWKFHQAKS